MRQLRKFVGDARRDIGNQALDGGAFLSCIWNCELGQEWNGAESLTQCKRMRVSETAVRELKRAVGVE